MAINKQTIEVNIDELALHGFSPTERYQIAAELQIELTRLFTEKGLPSSFKNNGSIEQLNAGSFQLQNNNRRGSAGSQIAASVYNSFSAGDNKTSK